jgi:hypothetical protein
MVLSRFSKKGQQTEGGAGGRKRESNEVVLNKHMEVRDSETSKEGKKRANKTLTVQMQLWRRSTKKRDREKRIPFVRSEGEAPLTANGSMWI